jgi:hypothetical protein
VVITENETICNEAKDNDFKSENITVARSLCKHGAIYYQRQRKLYGGDDMAEPASFFDDLDKLLSIAPQFIKKICQCREKIN